jgi:hypothetical protein
LRRLPNRHKDAELGAHLIHATLHLLYAHADVLQMLREPPKHVYLDCLERLGAIGRKPLMWMSLPRDSFILLNPRVESGS